MPSTVTTLAVFKTLLQRSVDLDPNLDSATKAAMRTRIQNLPSEQELVLNQQNASSVQGNVSEDIPNRAILIATGAPASPNRVEYDAFTFFVPVNVDGTHGVGGFLPGHAGTSVATLVDQEDVTLQYRLASTDPWANFDRSTVLDEVTWIQFAANIANQSGAFALPALHVHAEQI